MSQIGPHTSLEGAVNVDVFLDGKMRLLEKKFY